MKVDDKYLQRLGVLPYPQPRIDREMWMPAAGFQRGTHVTQLGVNPIVVDQADAFIWGQRTLNMTTERRIVQEQGRTLRAEWTAELAEDLQAVHGIDTETMLTEILAEEIRMETEEQSEDDGSVRRMMTDWMELIRSST